MTGSNFYSNINERKEEGCLKHDFKFLYVIGKGGFGKVWKVEHKKLKKLYAMK